MTITAPPGVFDILPDPGQERWKDSSLWQFVEKTIRKIAHDYGLKEIRTPIFEKTELFLRGVGETTDIVTKEMYTFTDKGDRSMTLRPEGTASAMRSFIENKLEQKGGVHKYFYIGPMFRYERSQAGRYRQHHQFGVEMIGVRSPDQDAEAIALLYDLYTRLGLKNLSVHINSIGDAASRINFRTALKDFLQSKHAELSPESQTRFETNPLRILDSKSPKDQELLKNAPSILDFLSPESKSNFDRVCKLLDLIGIPYSINPKLVRGLDYYNQTVFEVVAGELGAQNSVGGGGRYDGLISSLGGPDLPAVGFGTGIERIIQTMINQNAVLPKAKTPDLFLIPLGEEAKDICFQLAHELRQNNLSVLVEMSGKKLGKAMQMANSLEVRFTAVIGDEEVATKTVQLKEMSTGGVKAARFDQLKDLQCALSM